MNNDINIGWGKQKQSQHILWNMIQLNTDSRERGR